MCQFSNWSTFSYLDWFHELLGTMGYAMFPYFQEKYVCKESSNFYFNWYYKFLPTIKCIANLLRLSYLTDYFSIVISQTSLDGSFCAKFQYPAWKTCLKSMVVYQFNFDWLRIILSTKISEINWFCAKRCLYYMQYIKLWKMLK